MGIEKGNRQIKKLIPPLNAVKYMTKNEETNLNSALFISCD